MSDAERIAELVIHQARARLDNQFRESDTLDAKALGVLAADAAAIGVLVAVHDALPLWWLPAIGLGLAALFFLYIVWPRKLDHGPDWRVYYEAFGAETLMAASLKLLSELLFAIEGNEPRMPRKEITFRLGLLILVGALAASLVALR